MGEMELDPRPEPANGDAVEAPPTESHTNDTDTPTERMEVEQAPVETPPKPQAPTAATTTPTTTGAAAETTVEKVARFLGIPPAIPARQPLESTVETTTTATATATAIAIETATATAIATATAPADGESQPGGSPTKSSSPKDATDDTQSDNGDAHEASSSSQTAPAPPQSHTQPEKTNYSGKSFSDEHAGAAPGVVTMQNPRPDDETTDTASSLFSTGLSVRPLFPPLCTIGMPCLVSLTMSLHAD